MMTKGYTLSTILYPILLQRPCYHNKIQTSNYGMSSMDIFPFATFNNSTHPEWSKVYPKSTFPMVNVQQIQWISIQKGSYKGSLQEHQLFYRWFTWYQQDLLQSARVAIYLLSLMTFQDTLGSIFLIIRMKCWTNSQPSRFMQSRNPEEPSKFSEWIVEPNI